ncbi:MAG: hypothetical protein A2X46_14925 [Lentisphaerae bacterium GWF2_57_35]|nr:MAG: hypothetical protein A2X46_14925 [Lentisphaerae bacterium GWF2_57_35]
MLPEAGVFCIADGMGGVEGGAVASQQTLKMVSEALGADPRVLSYAEKVKQLKQALLNANRWIQNWAASRGNKGSGTTFVGLVLDFSGRGRTSFFHAGDSRGYGFRQGTLRQLTRDHSVASVFGAQNKESVPAMFKNVIMNAIGTQGNFSLEQTAVSVEAGDLFLLCSDGLTTMLADDEIAGILARHEEVGLEATAQALVQAANDAGGIDNTSVMLVKILSPLHSDAEEDDGVATDTHDALLDTRAGFAEATPPPEPPSTEDSEMLVRSHSDEEPTADHTLSSRGRLRFLVMAIGGFLLAAVAVILYFQMQKDSTPMPQPPSEVVIQRAPKPVVSAPPALPEQPAAPVAVPAAPEPPPPPALTEQELTALVHEHIESGRLGDLNARLSRNPALVEQLQANRQDFDAFSGWFSEWSRNVAAPDAVPSEFQSYRELMNKLLSSLGVADANESELSWPAEAAERATLKCQLMNRLQNQTVEAALRFMEQWETESSALGNQPDRALAILEASAAQPGLKAADAAIESGMTDFRRWLDRSRARPIAAEDWERVAVPFVVELQKNMTLLRNEVWARVQDLSPESVRRVAPSGAVPVVLEIKRRHLAALSGSDAKSVWAEEASRTRLRTVLNYLCSVAAPAPEGSETAP